MSLCGFELMESNRWYAGAISDKAREFAQGDNNRLAAAATARFFSDRGVPFEWDASEPTKMKLGGYWNITIRAVSTGDDTIVPDATKDPEEWVLYANTVIPGVIVLMGLTYRCDPFPLHFLLSLDEFIRGVVPPNFAALRGEAA